MLRSLSATAALALVCAPSALASDLALEITSNGATAVTAAPGSTLPISVGIELCDANNLGLAGIFVDLTYDGGDLSPLSDPTAQPLANFASPLGLSNPAGFGGTPVDGDLIQIGGAQNTINQFFAPKPVGVVVTSVAHPGSPEVLGTTSIVVPNVPGTYTVDVLQAGANVIAQGATGSPFWEVEPSDVMVTPLVITVDPTLEVDTGQLSLSSGGTANFVLDAGVTHANRLHLMLGSVTGTAPATVVGGLSVPLALDAYTNFTLAQPLTPPLVGGFGTLDALGQGAASFVLPAGTAPTLAGTTVHHAYVLVLPTLDFSSNAVSFTLVP